MSDAGRFEGARILVVGATGSLGGAIARSLAASGAQLCLSGRDAVKLDAIASELSGEVFSCDLMSADDRTELARALDVLDGVVFSAGIAPVAPVRYLKDADLGACLQLNTEAPLLLIRDLLKKKKLNRGASIVCLSSVAAARGAAGYAAYSASKAALEASARCLALELVPKGMRVNCVAPGMIEGEMADSAAERISGEALAAHLKAYPLGAGRPSDVASAVVFLLSGESRWITGVTLPVDGGFLI